MQTQSNTLNFTGQNIYVGFDVHLKSWKVAILTDELAHKTFSQPPKPEVLSNYLKHNIPGVFIILLMKLVFVDIGFTQN